MKKSVGLSKKFRHVSFSAADVEEAAWKCLLIKTDKLTMTTMWQHKVITVKQTGMGRYVGFTPMWERTICGFRAGRRGYAASLLCRHINVIKTSDFLSSIVNLEYGPLRSLEALSIMWIARYTCCLFSGWALTFIAVPRRLPLSLTHISSSPWDQRKPTYSLIIEANIAAHQ